MNKSVLIGITFIMAFSLVASGASQQGTGEAVGYFSVASVPGEAQVVMDSIYRGNTPVVVPVPLAGTPSHTLTVSKPGYLPWVRTYETGRTCRPKYGSQTVGVRSAPPRE